MSDSETDPLRLSVVDHAEICTVATGLRPVVVSAEPLNICVMTERCAVVVTDLE